MVESRSDLRPKRNLVAERQLKSLILEIEGMLQQGQEQIEEKIQQAAAYVVTPGKLLDLEVIREYETWTDLDTLVTDLTMEVPSDVHLTKDEFKKLAFWINENVINGMEGDKQEYYEYYYDMLFSFMFPDEISYDIMERFKEGDPIEGITAHLYPA